MTYNNGVPWASGFGNAPSGESNNSGGNNNPDGPDASGYNSQYGMMGMLGGGLLGGALGGLFGHQGDPSAAANQYLNQMPGAISPYMQPYMNAGGNAIGSLQSQYSNLLNNPGGMLNQIGQGYHQSPGFNFAMQQALMGANQASGAGGMAGSPQAQQQNMGVATGLANQDYYNWLQQSQGMYGAGLSGEQGLAGLGMQGATNMSNLIANQLQNQAAMAYANQANKNQASSNMWGDLGGIAGSLFGFK